ncbi:hypothetical protein K8I31_11995 [bacterium]|nr:hypothetical protein [bacterium]
MTIQKRFVIFVLFIVSISSTFSQIELPLTGPQGETYLTLGTLLDHAISPDGSTIVSASNMGIFVWNIETGELLDYNLFDNAATDVSFTEDGYAFVLFANQILKYDISDNSLPEASVFSGLFGRITLLSQRLKRKVL